MAEVESFTLDHTAVKAPYVRLINVESGPKGDQISNFDVRLPHGLPPHYVGHPLCP